MSKENMSSDEVDLGSLFRIIGKGIQNFFNAIGTFFAALYHYLILFLLFLRNNAIKLGIAALVGGGIGLYLDITEPPIYSSKMIVEPNFKSTQQLYNNIAFYHELVKQKDTTLLAKSLSISTREASKLKGFYIEPIKNNNEKYEAFNNFAQELDTIFAKNIDINDFKKEFSDLDFRYHEIVVKSSNSLIFSKLGEPIINSIENNTYYKNLKEINDENFLQNQRVLEKSLTEIDTLRKIYNEVLITEAKKMESGNVVSTFGNIGLKERTIFSKYTFIIGVGATLLVLLFMMALQLNRYLLNYRKN